MTQPFTMNGLRVPIAETMGAELLESGDGRCKMRYPVMEAFTNPLGQLQGGVFAVLMDSAMAVASGGLATATMQFSIFRPAHPGMQLIVTGEVVKRGKSIIYAEAEVRDEAGNLVARGNQNGVPRRST